MKSTSSHLFIESKFCANPKYELLVYDRLPSTQQELLKDLTNDPTFYGVLRPLDDSGLGFKSVSRDTALLYLTLERPGTLPAYVQKLLGDRCNTEIMRLVLDGVLAIEHNGRLLSGPDAADLMGGTEERSEELEGFLEKLSLDAIRYGQGLKLDDPIDLSNRLYGYNRTPLTSYWKHLLRDASHVSHFLGLTNAEVRDMLESHWLPLPEASSGDGWFSWQAGSLGIGTNINSHSRDMNCKLYISVSTADLPRAFPPILEVLSATNVTQFKVGKTVAGLLRADKLVAYFKSYRDLIGTAEALKVALRGCAAQGVPFTWDLGTNGLLSMGVDPPPDRNMLSWIGPESWRMWVCNRLAVSLVAASRNAGRTLEPWRFALRRLELEGVNLPSWTPASFDVRWCLDAGMV